MRARFAFLIVLVLLTAGAFLLRSPFRGIRPFHADESVHAVKFRDIWEHGRYRYDPNEFHGPTLYYAALPIVKWFHRQNFADTREGDYRLVTVFFGAALIPLFALFANGIGKRAVLIAGLFCAVSPAFVFYSRYYIQEIPLAFFTLAFLGCAWRYRRSPHFGWAIGAGLCAGLMIATKETAALSFAAGLAAFALTNRMSRKENLRGGRDRGVDRRDRRGVENASLGGVPPTVLPDGTTRIDSPPIANALPIPSLAGVGAGGGGLAVGAAIVAACLFLSGFGSNWRGPLDYFRAYTPWLKRAGGTEMHRHGAAYYLQILCWSHTQGHAVYSEGLIVALALIGIAAAFANRVKFSVPSVGLTRFIALYTLFLTLIYSVTPYKTPWCLLTFLTGLILLAGVGADVLLRVVPGKIAKAVVAVLLLIGAYQLEGQAKRASYTAYADPENPYVYAQTVPDVLNLYQRMNDLAEASPQHNQTVIQVAASDGYYWPLPWYLRPLRRGQRGLLHGRNSSRPRRPHRDCVLRFGRGTDKTARRELHYDGLHRPASRRDVRNVRPRGFMGRVPAMEKSAHQTGRGRIANQANLNSERTEPDVQTL